jgi:hypothetical protein
VNWVRGDTIEWVWEQLHHVETELIPHTPESRRADLLAAVDAHLREDPPKDAAGKERAKALAEKGKIEKLDRVRDEADYLIREAHTSSTSRHIATRSLRNRLLTLSLAAFAAAVALLVAQALMSNTIVPRPTNVTVPGTGLLALVLLGGLTGGLLTSVQVLTAKRASVFDPAAARAVFRAAFGAITGLLGVLLVDSGWVTTGAISSLPAMMLLAVAFGASQEAITRIIERKTDAMQDTHGTGAGSSTK